MTVSQAMLMTIWEATPHSEVSDIPMRRAEQSAER